MLSLNVDLKLTATDLVKRQHYTNKMIINITTKCRTYVIVTLHYDEKTLQFKHAGKKYHVAI